VLPSTLTESVAVCETARRPLLLVSLLVEAIGAPSPYAVPAPPGAAATDAAHGRCSLHRLCADPGSLCVVFSSSVETTHRLCRLLQLFHRAAGDVFGGRVAEMSRLMRAEEREAIMASAAAGEIRVLVSSDHMARGIDLPNIKLIVNYDPPKVRGALGAQLLVLSHRFPAFFVQHAKTYVHRVGRTARANRAGHSLTLLKAGQVGMFRKMRSTIASPHAAAAANAANAAAASEDEKGLGLLKCKVNGELEKQVEPAYTAALKQLPGVMEREARGELNVGADVA